MKIVLDTSTLISGIFWKEYVEVIDRFVEADIDYWKEFIMENVMVVEPSERHSVITEDPDDNKFLDAAVEAKVDYMVSSDRHLRNLKEFRGIKILSPKEFLEEYERLRRKN